MQCQSGNTKGASLLVKRWHARLCKQAYWYTNDIEISKDIVQHSWVTVFKKINSLKDPNSFGSWALTILNRNAIDWLRKNKKAIENLKKYDTEYNNTAEEIFENSANEKRFILLKKAIRQLPKEQQMLLHLFYIEEYSVRQISGIIAIPVGTIKSRLFNIREKLKLILKNK